MTLGLYDQILYKACFKFQQKMEQVKFICRTSDKNDCGLKGDSKTKWPLLQYLYIYIGGESDGKGFKEKHLGCCIVTYLCTHGPENP